MRSTNHNGHVETPGSATEVELKFLVAPEDLRHLARSAPLAGIPAVRRSLTSVYYDTSDLAVKRQGMSLRVRKEGKGYVQTLKGDRAFGGASIARPEFEMPVAGRAPDLSRPELAQHLDDIDRAGLRPVFASHIRRSTRLFRPAPDTAIEISIDRGSIETPAGGQVPVCEIEIELKQGTPAALFETARALNRAKALHLEARSKANRGYALVEGHDLAHPAPARRYGRIELDRDMTVEGALAQIVRRCLEHMLVNDPAAGAGDAEGVHQMRVALRRLRATLSLFKRLIPADQLSHVTGELKWLSGALGAARNWDIVASLIDPVAQAFAGDTDAEELSEAVAGRQRGAYDALRAAMGSSRYTEAVLDLMAWVEMRAWRRQDVSDTSVALLSPLGTLADALLERRYRKMRKLARRFDELDAGRRHEFRIALKKLRYAADSFERLYKAKAVGRYLKRLSTLQNDLGQITDIAATDGLIHDLPPRADATGADLRRAGALVQGWTRRQAIEAEAKLSRKVSDLLKAKRFWQRPDRPAPQP